MNLITDPFTPCRMISTNVSCSYRVVVHSSAASVASDAQKKIFSDEKYNPDPQFKLTVIWKGGE